LLDQRKVISTKLKAFGYDEANGGAKVRKANGADPGKSCSVCGELGHDGRRHRGEKASKKR
jgi:hypothetical protein